MTDTFFADVSEFQAFVDDSYPYKVLSLRANDGTYQDHNFWHNYPWMRANLDSCRLAFGIVYCYCRTNWDATAQTLIDQVNNNGGLHPRVALMLDVENGGNPGGDCSDWINRTYWKLADWAGNPARIIGYANAYDFYNMWPTRPAGLQVIGAGYGINPHLIGQVAHQYTDGRVGCGGDLVCGCSPFDCCDMNSADGLDPWQFAARCGIAAAPEPSPGGTVAVPNLPQELWALLLGLNAGGWAQLDNLTSVDAIAQVRDQLLGPNAQGWPQLGGHTLVDAVALLVQQQGIVQPLVSEANKTPSRAQEDREERARAKGVAGGPAGRRRPRRERQAGEASEPSESDAHT
jgi:hypothetical protein